jgi:hypothetical protein
LRCYKIDLHSKGFILYLKKVYKDRNIPKEIRAAKSMDQKWELAKKYSKDYAEYKKINRVNMAATTAYVGAVLNELKGFYGVPSVLKGVPGIPLSITAALMFGAPVFSFIKTRLDRNKKQNQLYNDYLSKNNNEEDNE